MNVAESELLLKEGQLLGILGVAEITNLCNPMVDGFAVFLLDSREELRSLAR